MTGQDLKKEMEKNNSFTDALQTYNNTVAYNKRKKEKNLVTESSALVRVLWSLQEQGIIKILK